jgi:hypothetical protein
MKVYSSGLKPRPGNFFSTFSSFLFLSTDYSLRPFLVGTHIALGERFVLDLRAEQKGGPKTETMVNRKSNPRIRITGSPYDLQVITRVPEACRGFVQFHRSTGRYPKDRGAIHQAQGGAVILHDMFRLTTSTWMRYLSREPLG